MTGGRVTRAGTIHLTLAFIGPVAAERLRTLVECGQGLEAIAFDLRLEECRWWKHNGIVWAGPRQTPRPLAELATRLAARLAQAGFPVEKREYKAHVTLVRKAALASGTILPPLDPVEWRCEEFVLVRSALSAAGPDYEILERFALA